MAAVGFSFPTTDARSSLIFQIRGRNTLFSGRNTLFSGRNTLFSGRNNIIQWQEYIIIIYIIPNYFLKVIIRLEDFLANPKPKEKETKSEGIYNLHICTTWISLEQDEILNKELYE